jgi:hypothetical protein
MQANRQFIFRRKALAQATALPTLPTGKRTYFRDSRCTGLAARLTSTSAVSLQWVKKVLKTSKRVVLGVFDATLNDTQRLSPADAAAPLDCIAARAHLSDLRNVAPC